MADSGKQSPLGINVIGSLIENIGFYINPTAQSYMGTCKYTDSLVPNDDNDYKFGKLVEDTSLKWLTCAINDGYRRGAAAQSNPASPTGTYTLTADTYNNLISIGKGVIPALGNSPPNTWKTDDPSGVWVNQHTDFYTEEQAGAPANSGYPFYNWDEPSYTGSPPTPEQREELAYKNEGQLASWYPWRCTTSTSSIVPNRGITQWGWLRCFPLQAWQEFNFNGKTVTGNPNYTDFCFSFNAYQSFMGYINTSLYAISESKMFLKGTYSNQNDLISADVLGVSLASRAFGQDLINLGSAIDFSLIKTFGLPSTTLQTLYKNNALTTSFVAALMASGITQADIINIANGTITASKIQEQSIYSAMLVIIGPDLAEILLTLNCRTDTLEVLADLVNIKKMFPLSYATLTVPIYNAQPGPTNSKTYYPLYINGEMNSQLLSPPVQAAVGSITPPTDVAPPMDDTEPAVVVPPTVSPPRSTPAVTKSAVHVTSLQDYIKAHKNTLNIDLFNLIKSKYGNKLSTSALNNISNLIKHLNTTQSKSIYSIQNQKVNATILRQINNILSNKGISSAAKPTVTIQDLINQTNKKR